MDTYIKIDELDVKLITIVNAIKHVTGIDIRNTSRKKKITYLKKIYYKIARTMSKKSLDKIANFVKTTNHGTVLFHLKDVEYVLETNEYYRNVFNEVLDLVNKTIDNQIEEEGDKIIYYVQKFVKVEKEPVFVDKMVDVGLPIHIIEHLQQYTDDELQTLYSTRLIPFARMLKKEG